MTAALRLVFSTKLSVFRLILFFSLTTCYLLLTAIISPVHAQSNETPVETTQQSGADEELLTPVDAKNYTPQAHILYTLMNMGGYAAGCLGEGTSLFGGRCLEMVGSVNSTADSGATPYLVDSSIRSGGALGMLGNAMTAMITTPPTSPVQYLASVSEGFGIKPAFAQTSGISGSGNTVIEPILKLWQLTRNLAYFGFILIFMAIGFMIMFRQKLNAQTVISAQNALPGVVVALILVTFSYFIAALIIDVGFVATQLTGRLLAANGLADQDKINETLTEKNFLGLYGSFISPPMPGSEGGGVFDVGADADKFGDTAASTLSVLNQGIVGQIVTIGSFGAGCYGGAKLLPAGASLIAAPTGVGRIGTFLSNNSGLTSAIGCLGGGTAATGAVSSGLIFYGIGVLIYVVMIFALLIAMGKTFFELIKAYISLMLQTVFAPLIIMAGAIPGQGGAFGGWAKTMLANVLIFPAVFAAFFFAAFIMGRPDNTFGIPPEASGDFGITSTVPLLGGLTGEFIKLILVYGILLIIPSIPGEVKKAFKVQDSPLGGAAVGGALAGYGVAKAVPGRLLKPYIKQAQALQEAEAKAAVINPGNGTTKKPGFLTGVIKKVI